MILRFGVAVLYASAFLSSGSPWAVAGINIVFGCSWVAVVLWLLPYEVQWLNRLQASYGEEHHFCWLGGTLTLLLTVLRPYSVGVHRIRHRDGSTHRVWERHLNGRGERLSRCRLALSRPYVCVCGLDAGRSALPQLWRRNAAVIADASPGGLSVEAANPSRRASHAPCSAFSDPRALLTRRRR